MIQKVFHAYDVRATFPNPLGEDAGWKVGYATGLYLQRSRQNVGANQRVKMESTVCVGRDMRTHSPILSRALCDGLRAAGLSVIDLGVVDTPLVYFAINHLDCLGGVQATASHNPAQYNGFKISGAKARPIGANTGLDDIKRIASTLRVGKTGIQGDYLEMDLWAAYRRHVLSFLHLGRKLRVMVDASNGMAGKMLPAIFSDTDHLEIIRINFEHEGSFVHDPNPLVEANLEVLKEKMRQEKPDLGVCFDGDADRCIFLDEDARVVGSDLITAILAKDFLRQPANLGSTIVYDLRSSRVVAEEIRKSGGVPRRERCGHTFLRRTLAETRGVFGGELSGHFYFRDNFFCDSGAIALARVLSIVSNQVGELSTLVAPLRRYAQSGELNFQVEDKEARIRELADIFRQGRIDYLDGVTIDLGEWWFNVRSSNTEPLLRLNVEAASSALLGEKVAQIRKILSDPMSGTARSRFSGR